MSQETTRDVVKKLIAEQLNKPVDGINESDTLVSLGADSLDQVEIVMKLEEHFGIEVNDADAEKICTVGQAINYIESLRK